MEPESSPPSIEMFLIAQEAGDEALIGALREVPDPDRMVIIDILLLRDPILSNWDLCVGLTQQEVLSNCEARLQRTRGRPHLWGSAAQNDRDVDMNAIAPVLIRSAAGPGQTTVQFGDVESMYSELTPIPSSCELENYDCRILEARNAVSPTGATVAGQMCMAVQSRRWRDECFFRLAEATTANLAQSNTALRDGIEFCLMAGEFRNYCAEQVFALSIDLAAPLFAPRSAWEPALEQLSVIREQWSGRREFLAVDIEQRFWSVLVQRSVSVSRELCGDPMDWLPEASAPHFRSAIAYRFVADALEGSRLPGEGREDLQGWIDGVRGALAERCHGEGSLIREDSRWRSIKDYWPIDEPGDENIPATTYLNGSRRPYDDVNPEIDEIIATVEALARFEYVPDSLIMSVRNHESEIVRWSVNRLYLKRAVRPPNSSYDGP